MKTSARIVILSGALEPLSISGAPPIRAGTVARATFEQLLVGGGICAGAVAPKYASEVGLGSSEEDGVSRFEITTPLKPTPEMYERGELLVSEARAAARNDLGRLRPLCFWFPLVLRMPEVKVCLDRLPRERALQIAAGGDGYGPEYDILEAFGRVATMRALQRERKISIAAAARLLAKAVPVLNVTPRTLENLHAELGRLVSCVDGYAVPASALSARPWGARDDDDLRVYVPAEPR